MMLSPSSAALRHGLGRVLLVVLVTANVTGALPSGPAAPAAAAPGVGQVYYTPFEAQDFLDTLREIRAVPSCCNGPVVSTISLTSSANGNTVVYDHFEDGYEADPSSPVQASTLTLSLDAGDVWTQSSNVPTDTPGRGPGNFFDGRDKIVATRPLAVSHAAYASTPGTVHAGAVAAYDTNKYGRRFDLPVGEDANYNRTFDHVGLLLVGSEAGTTVLVDADNNGTFETSLVIGEGETRVLNTGMSLGARIEADKPIGVYVSTGDNSATYEGRFFELFPTETWAASYVTPVGSQNATTGATRAFLYNPGLADITVDRTDGSGGTGSINVPAQGQASYQLPVNEGALFASDDGSPFYAIQLITTESTATSAYDWGFTLVPSDVLAPSFVVPYGPGSGGTPPSQNYSPVWLAALGDTDVYVDLDGDPATGTPDANGWGYDFVCTVDAYESWTIYDDTNNACIRPNQNSLGGGSRDLTGARIYTNDGTKLTAAWGQRPNYTGGSPALDMGTTIFPSPAVEVLKDAEVTNDLDGDGLLDPGDTLTYTIVATNYGIVDIVSVTLTDETPVNTVYVPNSATVNGSGVPDDVGPFSPSPLDLNSPAAGLPVGTVLVDGTATVTFDVVLDDPLPFGFLGVPNSTTLQTSAGPFIATTFTPLDGGPLQILKSSVPSALPLQGGDTIDYTIEVFNADTAVQTVLVVSDALPTGTTYQPGSVLADIDGLPIAAAAPPTLVGGESLQPGELLTITFSVDVDASIPAGVVDFTNVATASSDQRGPVNASVVDPADPQADLAVTKTDAPDPQRAGNQVTYTIQVDNLGPDGAASVQVVDTLPAGVTFNSTSPPGLCVEAPAGTLTCDLGDLAVGNTLFDVVVDVAAATSGTVSNSATVGSTTPDPVPGNNTEGEDTLILNPSIAVTKSTSTPLINSGDSASYGYTVENTGNEAFAFPAALTIVDDSCAPVTGPTSGDINTNNVLDPGETWAFACSTTLSQDTINTVTVTATSAVGPPVVETDQATVDVVPSIVVSKTPSVTDIDEPGGAVTFTVSVENTGSEDVDVTAIDDSVFGDILAGLNPAITGTTCAAVTVIPGAGNAYSCTFSVDLVETAVDSPHVNTVDVTAEDDEGNSVSDDDSASITINDVVPSIVVSKTPSVTDIDEPGGAVTFTVSVENTGSEDVDVTAIDDSVFGDILAGLNPAITGTTCAAVTVIPGAGNAYSCTFSVDLVETAVDSPHVNTVDVTAEDDEGNSVSDDDSASITINSVVPTLTVTKVPTPGALDEPGGTVSFAIHVTNNSTFEAVTLTALTDDVYGDLTLVAITSCGLPQVIGPGSTYACVFSGDINETAANSPHQNTVTADGVDDESSPVTDSDTADVVINDVLPAISVTKTASPPTVPAAGGPVTFTVVVANAGVEPVTVTSLGDDIYGDITDALNPLLDATTCTLPQALGVAGSYSCTFSATPSGVPGGTEVDTVTATATDDEANPANAVDSATVTFGDAEISGQAWLDTVPPAGNSLNDPGEPSISGLTVELLDDLGNTVATTLTDGSGGYVFDGLVAGDYQLRVTPPSGGNFVTQDAGTDDAIDSDVDSSGLTTTVTLAAGQTIDTIDAGIQPASLTDSVWLDLDADGTRDPGEDGIAGVAVELLDDLGNLVTATTTDAGGDYAFAGLEPGDYSVRVVYPGALFSPAGPDSDVDAGGQTPAPFPMASGPNTNLADAGVTPALIGDYVWLDLDTDGVQDPGEPGAGGVTVNLYDGLNNLVDSATSDAAGAYSFAVNPGDYRVEMMTSAPMSFTTQDAGGDDAVDSDVNGAGSTGVFTAPSGASTDAADAGLLPASIVDSVWLDLDNDGVQDVGESGIEGVPVNLYDDLGNLVGATATDAAGQFAFLDLRPGDYEVEVAPVFAGSGFVPAGQGGAPALDSDVDPVTGRVAVSAPSGLTSGAADAGVVPGSMADLVWLDQDRNGLQDAGEPGMAGIVVNLFDDLGNLAATTTTDPSGQYLFDGLVPADYEIEVVAAGTGLFTTQDAGADDTIDSDVDATTGLVPVSVDSGSNVDESAAGLLPGLIAGTLWFDDDADTTRGPGESGMTGITVELYDDLGGLVASALTPAGGSYSFDGLEPGDYTVQVDVTTIPPLTSQTYDLDGLLDHETIVTVALSEDVTGVDFGYQAPAAVSGVIFEDVDGNGVFDAGESPLAGVDVTISDSVGNVFVVTTAVDGSYSSPVEPGSVTANVVEATLPAGVVLTTANEPQTGVAVAATTVSFSPVGYQPPAPVSGVVWDDVNGDGVQDPGEPVLDGVTVTAVCAGPDATLGNGDDVVLADALTAGPFSFPAVPVGTCGFAIDSSSLPAGLTIATYDLDGGDDSSAIVAVPIGGRADVDFGVRGSIDLYLTKVSTEGNVQAGDQAEWILTVANIGLSDAPGPITLTDDLPDGLDYVSAGGAGWSCTEVASVVTCEHPGPLAVGDDLEVRIITDVDAELTGTVNNSAEVATPGDVVVLNNFAVAGIGLLPSTGFNLADALTWSLLSLLLGAGLILVTRRRDEDHDLARNS